MSPGEQPAPPLLVVLEHAGDEGPGLIAEVAASSDVNLRRLGTADPLPRLGSMSALLVMGGPQSVYSGEPRLRAEVALLHEAVTQGLPVLGICLGAQLLAAACGAAVRPGEQGQELGLGTVALTAPARDDPVFAGCGAVLPALHWHADTFELPPGSCHLASSGLYPNQGFRLGRAYGFQFHLEVDAPLLAAWSPRLSLPSDSRDWLRETEPVRRRVLANWLDQALDAVP